MIWIINKNSTKKLQNFKRTFLKSSQSFLSATKHKQKSWNAVLGISVNPNFIQFRRVIVSLKMLTSREYLPLKFGVKVIDVINVIGFVLGLVGLNASVVILAIREELEDLSPGDSIFILNLILDLYLAYATSSTIPLLFLLLR